LHLANVPGMVIGDFDAWSLLVDGINSMFPIYHTSSPGEPLWKVHVMFQDDPFREQFSDCVRINLNKAHKDFKYLDERNEAYNTMFLKQVIASAMNEIMMTLMDIGVLKDLGNDVAEAGSLMMAIERFTNDLGWNTDDLGKLHDSVMTFFDKEWKL
jgi:hypothetical protein